MDKIIEKINLLLTKLNMSKRDFAKGIGVSEVTVQKILNNQQSIKVETLQKIANVLGVDIREFFEETNVFNKKLMILLTRMLNYEYNRLRNDLKNSKISITEITPELIEFSFDGAYTVPFESLSETELKLLVENGLITEHFRTLVNETKKYAEKIGGL